jgi:hypothetical protein
VPGVGGGRKRPKPRFEGFDETNSPRGSMTLVFDAGALISLERDERASWIRLKAAYLRGEIPLTNAAVLGQVWRGELSPNEWCMSR